ncbi:MAG: glycosyltransferase [Ferruginibacter sp.]
MKIIHCLNHFFPQHFAGTEIYTLSLVHALQKKNIESIVLVPNFGKTITEEYNTKNIRVIKYAEPSIADRELRMGNRRPSGLQEFLQVLVKEDPSIVHFHAFTRGNGITIHHIFAAKEKGFKVVMTFHLAGYTCKTDYLMYNGKELCNGYIDAARCTSCIYTSKNIGGLKKKLLMTAAILSYKATYDTTSWNNSLGTAIGYPFIIEQLKKDVASLGNQCDKLVVLAEWYKKILILNDVPADKIISISQGLPENLILKEQLIQDNEILKVIFIGRINRIKGIELLIKAVKPLPSNNISLDIFGKFDDPEFEKFCQSETKYHKNIRWMGGIEPETIVNVIAGYKVLCLPSLSEMSPLVIQEAYAAGVPVIASDIYGNAEHVKDNITGWLFKFNDSKDLQNKLKMLMDDPQKLALVRKQLPVPKDFNAVAAEYEKLYIETVKAG